MPYQSVKHLEEQIPNHLSATVKEIIRRHLREEYLKKLDESKAIPIIELTYYIKSLRRLILALILNELGLSKEDIIKLVQRSANPLVDR